MVVRPDRGPTVRTSQFTASRVEYVIPHAGRGGGGYSEKEMRARHEAVLGEHPMLVKCEFCRYRYEGPVAKAVALIAAHRARRHPQLQASGGKRARERARAELLAERRRKDSARRAAA